MEKVINVLLVVVLVLMLKNMYFPKKANNKKHIRKAKREESHDEIFSKSAVDFKNLVMSKKGKRVTQILPVGTLEVITQDGESYVPVSFNKHGQFTIGSADDCDLVLRSPYIGAHHCSIEYDDENDEIVLFDNDSKNGIYNESRNRVEELVLKKGKKFYLAKCITLTWNDYNAFQQTDEEELPVMETPVKKEKSLSHTKTYSTESFANLNI